MDGHPHGQFEGVADRWSNPQTDRWIRGRMDESVDGLTETNRRMDDLADGPVYRWSNPREYGPASGRTIQQTDGQTRGRTDGPEEGQTELQTNV